MTSSDIPTYLDSRRKSDEEDPLHKLIGYYNSNVKEILRSSSGCTGLKSLRKRGASSISNPPYAGRGEKKSRYTHLLTCGQGTTLPFLKYCPVKRADAM
ncbi:MAG TPA: hypothetical protein VNI77_10120 [Nitrososphaera sp.]|nr:hypothetical protein [Nitrososphaera sp.]